MSRFLTSLIVGIGLVATSAAKSTADEKESDEPAIEVTSLPREDELAVWIKAIRRKGFVLLHA